MDSNTLKYGASKVARIFGVDRTLVKTWAYHFQNYLNPNANPGKGIEREFTVDDLSTLAYIFSYWEDEPDIQAIEHGLNNGYQFEEPFKHIAMGKKPIFQEFSDDFIIEDTWMIGGFAEIADRLSLADSFKEAGDTLISKAIENDNKELIYPTIYSYRHAIELYLKTALEGKFKRDQKHNLDALNARLKKMIAEKFNITPPDWYENLIAAFHDIDPGGTTFRYGESIKQDELFTSPHHLKKMMEWLSESMHRIIEEL